MTQDKDNSQMEQEPSTYDKLEWEYEVYRNF